MHYKFYLTLLLLTTLGFAQKPDYDFVKAERDCRKLIYSNPDSAVVVIKRTLAQRGDLHDTIYGNTYALYGLYYNMKGKPDSTIYFLRKSLTYLDKYPRNKTRSLVNLSMGYRAKADYKAAIACLNENIAINTKEKNDIGVAIAYGEMASNYNLMMDYNTSIDYLLKAQAILKNDKRGAKQLPAVKQKLANTYLAMNNFRFAIDLYRESLVSFKEIGQLKNYYLTQVNLAEALIHVNDFNGAKKALTEAITGLEKFGDKEMLGICYSKIGNLEFNQKNTTKAIAAYQTALNNLIPIRSNRAIRIAGEYIDLLNKEGNYTKSLQIVKAVDKINVFNLANREDQSIYKNAVADAYDGTHNDKEALAAYKNTIDIMDSLSADDRKIAIRDIQAKFQTELQREKNLALEANNKALKNSIKADEDREFMYRIARFTVLLIVLLITRGFWLKNRLQKELLKTVEAEKTMLEQRHLHEQELSNAQRETIKEKQRELTSTALRMASYQDAVNEIIEKCDSNALSKIPDVKKELLQLVRQQDYWKQFETRFNNLHPEFGTSLTTKFSKLTKNDIEFCSLLKLNLSNKEIASLLQISHESAITKKYRIKKKMEINDDDAFEKLLMEI
ncbi:tetratricopeptide repeat protein [Flavobacterium rivuli]|nr:tetratricopeptide repeat protein [Flavobacterium rivuli]